MSSRPKPRQKKSVKRKAHKSVPQSLPLNTHLQYEEMAHRVAEERSNALLDKMPANSSTDGNRHLYELMQESYEIFGSLVEQATLNPPLACKQGCTYCCINQVSLTEPEAIYLGMHLMETRSPNQLLDLKDKTKALLEKLEGKSRQQIGMERHLHPCLFMGEETCSVYPARPFVCRGWNSVNADMCRHSNQSGDALAPIENHPFPRIMSDSIQLGLLNGARDKGLETGFLLLPRAVNLILENGIDNIDDLAQSWLAGKPFFAKKTDDIKRIF